MYNSRKMITSRSLQSIPTSRPNRKKASTYNLDQIAAMQSEVAPSAYYTPYESRRFICEQCGMRFYSLSNKLTHQRTYCWKREDDFAVRDEILRLKMENDNLYSSVEYLPMIGSSRTPVYGPPPPAPLVHHGYYDPSMEAYNRVFSDFLVKNLKYKYGGSRESISPQYKNKSVITPNLLSPTSPYHRSNSDAIRSIQALKRRLGVRNMANSSNVKVHVLRLKPYQDIYSELDTYVRLNNLKAAFIMTAVGSVQNATLRMAYDSDQSKERVKVFNEHMEVVSLVGTLSCLNGHHLHISLSNKEGKMVGGHLFGEARVFTTLEVTIGECLDLEFQREHDAETGYDELVVRQANVS